MRGAAQDRRAAERVGVSTKRVNLMAFGLGTAAVAGAVITPFFVNPNVDITLSLTAYVVVILGGLGSMTGAIVGGLLIGVIESFTGFYLDPPDRGGRLPARLRARPRRQALRPARYPRLRGARRMSAAVPVSAARRPFAAVIRARNWIGAAAFLLLLAGFVLTGQSQGITVSIITSASIWAAAACSWNILAGFGGQMSFGHAAFFGAGAYTMSILYIDHNVNPWVGLLAGGGVAMVLALLIGLPTFGFGTSPSRRWRWRRRCAASSSGRCSTPAAPTVSGSRSRPA